MIKKMLNKRTAAVLLSILMLMAFAVTAFASPPPEPEDNLPDPEKVNSLTVHKIITGSASNTPGTGLPLTEAQENALGSKLNGVEFTLYKIDPTAYTVTNTSLTELQAAPDTFVADYTVEVSALTTGSGSFALGTAKWENLAMGHYVLIETGSPTGVTPIAPAIITLPMGITTGGNDWNYDVHIYPKNVRTDTISKDFGENASGAINPATDIFNVGDTIPYVINAKIEKTLHDPATSAYGSFSVTDPLDERLSLDVDSVVVTAQGGAGVITLVKGTDYTMTPDPYALDPVTNIPTSTSTGPIVWTLTETGLARVTAQGSGSINITFDTIINNNAIGGSGGNPTGSATITNTASVTQADADGSPEEEKPTEENPTAKLAGVVIDKLIHDAAKYDETDPDTMDLLEKLDGAEFKIGTLNTTTNEIEFIKDAKGADIFVITGNNPDTTATEKGWAMFTGLAIPDTGTATYYLVETKVPEGFVRQQYSYEVTLSATDKIFTARILNQRVGEVPPPGEHPTFQLPQTGGIGTMLFVIVGIVLIGGAVLVLVKTRKKGHSAQ